MIFLLKRKWLHAVRIFFVKMTLMLFQPFFVLTATVQRLPRKLRRLLQMKEIITYAPCLLQFAQLQHIEKSRNGKDCLIITHPAQLKKTQKTFQNFSRKRGSNWPIRSFVHSGSETRIYRIPRGKMDRSQLAI